MEPYEPHGALWSPMGYAAPWSPMEPYEFYGAVWSPKALRGCRFPLRGALDDIRKQVLTFARLGFGPCAALRQALRGSSLRRRIWTSLARLVFGPCAALRNIAGIVLDGFV